MKKPNRCYLMLLCIASLCLLITRLGAGIYIVVNTNDSGAGSLRQAMINADRKGSGPDSIQFNIPKTDPGFDAASGTWTIQSLTEMRNLGWDSGTVIDGATQALFIGGDPNPSGPEIVIDGSLAGDENGFNIEGSIHNELKCLVIHGFAYSQIYFSSSDSNKVSGCYIGMDAAGTEQAGNGKDGISIWQSSWNVIGGETNEERNIISGLKGTGIYLSSTNIGQSNYNQIKGNYIGIGADGTGIIGNGSSGIILDRDCSFNEIGPGNIISGNEQYGITIRENADHNLIRGNRIGTDYSGLTAVRNNYGLVLENSSGNTIGGILPGQGNVISGNEHDGIEIQGAESDSNLVLGNRIGVNTSGEASLGNGNHGILILNGASENLIGNGTLEGANIISGNGRDGIQISGSGTDGNWIKGNGIGTGSVEDIQLGNGSNGIRIYNQPRNTVITQNIIAYNAQNGISIEVPGTVGHTIRKNSIHDNQSEGIEISSGGNLELAPPVITGTNPVTGTSVPDARIEVFSDESDEGAVFEGFVTADASGNFTLNASVSGPYVTATATDTSGNTSEFSSPLVITGMEDKGSISPEDFALHPNFPNPFNPVTAVRYDLPVRSQVLISVYNLTGQEIAVLKDEEQEAGRYTIPWYGIDCQGVPVPGGVYIIRLSTGGFEKTAKMMVVR